MNALQDLSVLKKSYNLIFTLDNYLQVVNNLKLFNTLKLYIVCFQDSIEETAFCILQRIHLDKLKSLVKDFLYPIFQEKGKSPVTPIKQYISLLVSNRQSCSTWLNRVVVCIDLLHNEDDRLEYALMVLKNSPVPRPEVVAPLIKLRFSTHPLSVEINTEYEIQVIKIMKKETPR